MAVYKSTHCYPFINNMDVRNTLVKGTSEVTYKELSCKVNTSNKNVTGYSIRILDEDNNVIFPVSSSIKISPISELQLWKYEPGKTNSGINGTFLKLPFFQNGSAGLERILNSYNAIYYKVKHSVDHLIYGGISGFSANKFENPANWILNAGDYEYDWGNDPTATDEDKKRNKIFLDGEVLVGGEIILVAYNGEVNGIPVGYYEAIKTSAPETEGGPYRVSTKLHKISDINWNPADPTNEEYFSVILKGETFSNKVIKRTGGTFAFVSDTEKLWKDVDGHNISINFTGTSMYKWEITLYQGNCTSVNGTNAVSCDYSNVGTSAYDMILNTGTVLGSTKDRIQIAYVDAYSSDGQPNASCTLPSQKEGTLVLQGKYVDFGRNYGSAFSNTRAYVQNYDATMGHVYPISGSVDTELVKKNRYVQFYKLTNDPEAIKDDKITYGFETNFTFYYYSSDDPSTELTLPQFEETEINKRLYGIKRGSVRSVSAVVGNALQDGDQILLTGQNNNRAFQNGVYEIYSRPDIAGEFSQTDLLLLKRFSPYNTWGGYIGKTFFVENFVGTDHSIKSCNIESMAGANPDASLWNPSVIGSGKANLLLNKEAPLLLFEEKIDDDKYFDAVYEGTLTTASRWSSSTYFDGVQASAGMKILSRLNTTGFEPVIRTFTLLEGGSYNISGEWDSYSQKYVYVRQGKHFGKRVIYINSETLPTPTSKFTTTWRLHTAKILKNATNFTYISPFIDIQENMAIKLMGNHFATLNDGNSTKTQWLSIKKINPLVYCVLHETLTESLVSDVSEVNNTPWKYEIRSFFKSSDFNPFYCYESPYLILYKNNMEYGGILTSVEEDRFLSESSSQFLGDQNIVFLCQDLGTNYSKPLKLSASYIQKNGLSWESYQWLLLNESGEILKDSGKKYDQELSIVFDGLITTAQDFSMYYVILYVEDSLKNILSYGIRLFVYRGGVVPGNFPFNATYDCGLHAIKLNYSGLSQIGISYRDVEENVDKMYRPGMEGSSLIWPVSSLWDDGLIYDNNGVELVYKDNESGAVVDFSRGSTISGTDAIPYEINFTRGTTVGIPYYRIFNTLNENQPVNENEILAFSETESGTINNQMYFETEVILNNNHCGPIFDLYVQGDDNEELVDDLYEDTEGNFSDLNGYIIFSLETEPNFTDEDNPTRSNVNEYRNRLRLKATIKHIAGSFVRTRNVRLEKIKTFADGGSLDFYLRPENSSFTPEQLLNTSFLNFKITQEMYFTKDKNGDYFTVKAVPLGNLCLNEWGGNFTISYWVENRPLVMCFSSIVGNVVYDDYSSRVSESHLLTWPQADIEQRWYWRDSTPVAEGTLPVFWEDFTASSPDAIKLVAMDKHYGMDQKKYHIVCKIDNINALYSSAVSDSFSLEEDSTTEDGVSQVDIKVNSQKIGEILIEQQEVD